jgi:hypothetical protein
VTSGIGGSGRRGGIREEDEEEEDEDEESNIYDVEMKRNKFNS